MFNQGHCTYPDCSNRHICLLICEGNHLGSPARQVSNMSKRPYDHSPLSVKLVCHNCLSACLPHRLRSALSLLCPLIHNLVIPLITPHNISAFSSKDSPQNVTRVSRSLLDECEYSPLLHLSCEHNDYNASLVSASLLQSTSLKHVAPSIDQLLSHLQQFLLQQNISLLSRAPLHASTLINELAAQPDQNFVHELIHNIQHGCSIGYNGPQFVHCSKNLPSAYQQPLILDNALTQECNAGHIL